MLPCTRLGVGEARAIINRLNRSGQFSGQSQWAMAAMAYATVLRTLLWSSPRPDGRSFLILALTCSVWNDIIIIKKWHHHHQEMTSSSSSRNDIIIKKWHHHQEGKTKGCLHESIFTEFKVWSGKKRVPYLPSITLDGKGIPGTWTSHHPCNMKWWTRY